MGIERRSRPRSFWAAPILLLVSAMACLSTRPPGKAGATPTPTGQIGAVEAGTPSAGQGDAELWAGTITSQTSRQYMEQGNAPGSCNTNWILDFDLAVDPEGYVRGKGQARLSEPRSCTKQPGVPNAESMTTAISGRKLTNGFDLKLEMPSYQPSGTGEWGGYVLLFSDGACPGTPRDISVPFSGPDAAEAQLNLTGVLSGCGGSATDTVANGSLVKMSFLFRCSQLPADQANPILKELCQ